MTDQESAAILFAMALSKREHADSLRDIDTSVARQRRLLLDQQADALDHAIEKLGGRE